MSNSGRSEKHLELRSLRYVDLVICLAICLLTFTIQVCSGAFRGDMAWGPDEPAHAVSSLMVRDYLAQAFGHNPLAFARAFYAHYPKVAIGHWPPLFYCAEALWMVVFGRSATAMLLFTGFCGALLVCAVYLAVRSRFSVAAACVSAAFLLSSRPFEEMVFANFPDVLLAGLIFAAAAAYGRYLDRENRQPLLLFGILIAAAMLTHGRGALLLFVPFCVRLFRRERFTWKWWVGVGAVLLLCQLPHRLGQTGQFRPQDIVPITAKYVSATIAVFGWFGVILALVGATLVFRPGPARGFLSAVSSIVPCNLLLLLLLPVPFENRYLLPTLVDLSVMAGAGLHLLLQRLQNHTSALQRNMGAVIAIAAMACAAVSCRRVETKSMPVYRQALAHCLLCGHQTALIGANSTDEGALIVEASLSDPLRTHTILRASKVLARSTWSDYDKRLLYRSPSAVLEELQQRQVSLAVVQVERAPEEDEQLLAALTSDPAHWRPSASLAAKSKVLVFTRQP